MSNGIYVPYWQFNLKEKIHGGKSWTTLKKNQYSSMTSGLIY